MCTQGELTPLQNMHKSAAKQLNSLKMHRKHTAVSPMTALDQQFLIKKCSACEMRFS